MQGPERVKGLYAFRSIIDEGARITLGTDCPVEGMNPLNTFYAAVTRVSLDGTSPHGPGGWFPDQILTRLEALRGSSWRHLCSFDFFFYKMGNSLGITIDPAYASFTEDILGSIVPGKRADYVVLSQDIMEVSPNEILNTEVLATVMDGKPVYGKL
jgi:predicted amidohydrolase YtcJ